MPGWVLCASLEAASTYLSCYLESYGAVHEEVEEGTAQSTLCGTDGASVSLVSFQTRDWNEELQTTRELPRKNLPERLLRERAIFKVLTSPHA